MPYIPDNGRRELLDIGEAVPQTVGELNYVITTAVDMWITAHGGARYTVLNEAIGILDEVKAAVGTGVNTFDEELSRWLWNEVWQFGYRANSGTNGQEPVMWRHVRGVLECAKLELYRRIAAPYEDDRLTEHGEVYRCAPDLTSRRTPTITLEVS